MVDVLSFTTTVCVAAERGITVLPFRWKDDRAQDYAEQRSAVLALDRVRGALAGSHVPAGRRPGRACRPPTALPISFGLAEHGSTVVAACLRNRSAVARWLVAHGGTVAVVAAGERWPDGSLRPCAEDLWGAGAVLALLDDAELSPEARLAAAAYRAVEGDRRRRAARLCERARAHRRPASPRTCDVAADLDRADVVPVLANHEFQPATN